MTTVRSYGEVLTTLRSELLRAAYARTSQLADLAPAGDSPVRSAHRSSVRRILDQIHAALDRMDAGTYGDCSACGTLIPLGRLEQCPWTPHCDPCLRWTL